MLVAEPMPPLESTVMPDGAETLFTVVTGIPALIVLGIAIRHIVRGQGPLLLFCFLGGGLAAFFEPVADILSCLYFPVEGQNVAYTTFDRPIPWALVLAYPWYVGGQGYLAYRLFSRRPDARRIWLMYAYFALSNVAVETPGVLTGFHEYYGNQPFDFWGFPLWQAGVQSIMPMAAGALICAVRSGLGNGWRLVMVVPLIPMADGMVNAGLALPVWTTLGSDMSLAANYVGAIVTVGMGCTAVWVLTVLFAGDRPRVAPAPEPVLQRL